MEWGTVNLEEVFVSRGNELLAKIPGKCPVYFVFGTLRSIQKHAIIKQENSYEVPE